MNGEKVRDLLLMLKAQHDKEWFERRPVKNILGTPVFDSNREAFEEAIWCVEQAYPEMSRKLNKEPEHKHSAGFVRNRLMTTVNFYCQQKYGYGQCFEGTCEYEQECGKNPERCKRRGWDDEFCKMIREAIRCVEVIGTGVRQ